MLAGSRNKLGVVLDQMEVGPETACGQSDLDLFSLRPGVSVDEAIRSLRRDPAVKYAEPNWVYTRELVPNDPDYKSGALWGMYGDATTPANQYGSQAGEAWAAGYTGSQTVYVGVIDEGIQFSHPDLDANVWTNPFDPVDGIDNDGNGFVDDIHGWDFVNRDNSVYDGGASGGLDRHGTHVAGTIGAEGNNATGVVGVNWNVQMISAKFLGAGGGTTADAIRSVDYLTDLKVRHGINIVATNNSWGGGGFSQALLDAIVRAAKQNILFIAAAGNAASNNDTTASYPSNYNTTAGAGYDAVIAVAALRNDGGLASFSNYGKTTVDLAAPGQSIQSTLPVNLYGQLSGTSMASPHVAGAAALYASTHPGASALTIRNAILNAAQATPTASLAGKTVTGGRLNVSGFVADLMINDVSATEGTGSSPKDFSFTVSLGVPSLETVRVNYATQNGSASAPGDFTAVPTTTLVFAPGQTSKTVTVSVNADSTSEPQENFFVQLSQPLNAALAQATGTGTILNDDGEITISDATLAEGTGSSPTAFQFTVTLKHSTAVSVTVDFVTEDGTATAGSDYTALAQTTLKFTPGQTSKIITVNVAADSTSEPFETFLVKLSNPTNGTIADNTGLGTIQNDDGEISVTGVTRPEGTGSAATGFDFTVSLKNPSVLTVRVDYETQDNTAIAGADYTGIAKTQLTFNPNETNKTVRVNVTADSTSEPTESFFVKLSNAINGAIAQAQAAGKILNDDGELSISDVSSAEGTGGSTGFVFNVTLKHASTEAVTVNYATADDTATAGSDYTAIPSTSLQFNPGEISKQVTVQVTGDSVDESNETFFVNLSNPASAVLGKGQGVGTILDDDDDVPPDILISDVAQAEGTGGSPTPFNFTVSLSKATTNTVKVEYTTAAGTATAGSDFTSISPTVLTFAPGETSKTITVYVAADGAIEPDETFFVDLSPAEAVLDQSFDGVPPGTQTSGQVSLGQTFTVGAAGFLDSVVVNVATRSSDIILDIRPTTSGGVPVFDDNLALASAALPNTNGVATDLNVNLSASALPVKIGDILAIVIRAPGSNGIDWSAKYDAEATYASGAGYQRLASNPWGLNFTSDYDFQTFVKPATSANIPSPRAIGTIVNDDVTPITITISDVAQAEGSGGGFTTFEFLVSLSQASSGVITVDVETADGSAVSGDDFEAYPVTTLVFQPGETNKIITVNVVADSIGEPSETFLVQLTNPINATLDKDTGVGTILNDDVEISIDDVIALEGTGPSPTAFVFTVKLNYASVLDVQVDYFTEDGSAIGGSNDPFSGADYETISVTTLHFNPGETSVQVTVSVFADIAVELTENFFVKLTQAINASIVDDTGEGTIVDDDGLID